MASNRFAFTPEIGERVLKAIRNGCTRETAARSAGISGPTLSKYIKRGRNGDPRLAEFAEKLKNAEAELEETIVGKLISAGEKHWQCWAWWLERKYPERWGRRGDPSTVVNVSQTQDEQALKRKFQELTGQIWSEPEEPRPQ